MRRAGAAVVGVGALIDGFAVLAMWAAWDIGGGYETPDDWSHRVTDLSGPVLILAMGTAVLALGFLLRVAGKQQPQPSPR